MQPRSDDGLTEHEREVIDELMVKVIEHARRREIEVLGIDHPAIAVRASLARWVVEARKFPHIV